MSPLEDARRRGRGLFFRLAFAEPSLKLILTGSSSRLQYNLFRGSYLDCNQFARRLRIDRLSELRRGKAFMGALDFPSSNIARPSQRSCFLFILLLISLGLIASFCALHAGEGGQG